MFDIKIDAESFDRDRLWRLLEQANDHFQEDWSPPRRRGTGIYGDGRAGPRIAALLAKTDPHNPALLRKRIAY